MLRIVIAGGGVVGRSIAEYLSAEGRDVIVIEPDRRLAEDLADSLDCTVIHGDPSKIETLKSIGLSEKDYFIATLEDDRDSLIAAFAAKSIGVKNIIVVLSDEDFEQIALGLGFYSVVLPVRLAILQVCALIKGLDIANLSTVLKGDARFFVAVISDKLDGIRLGELDLPSDTMPIAIYRGDEFILPKKDFILHRGDEVVFITRESRLDSLKKIFH